MTTGLRLDPGLGVEYVEVGDEPHHVEQFRNAHVRVYLATIDPGTCTLYHRHRVNTLYVVVSGGSSRSDEPGRQRQRTGVGHSTRTATKLRWWWERKLSRMPELPSGTLLMQYHAQFPLTHRLCASASNVEPIRMLGIELLSDPPVQDGRPLELGLPVEYHDRQATSYSIRLAPGQRTHHVRTRRPSLLVVMSGSAQILPTPGSSSPILGSAVAQWLDADRGFEMTNPGLTTLQALLISLNAAPPVDLGNSSRRPPAAEPGR